ncbi:MAG: hypothetical protein O7H40_17155 [Gammaproteobacteria bacterium]|nr:hypothetical protein [Gammaproteobacteria bacterium]
MILEPACGVRAATNLPDQQFLALRDGAHPCRIKRSDRMLACYSVRYFCVWIVHCVSVGHYLRAPFTPRHECYRQFVKPHDDRRLPLHLDITRRQAIDDLPDRINRNEDSGALRCRVESYGTLSIRSAAGVR